MMRLLEALKNIKAESLTSFFMPGHKNGRHLKYYLPLDYAFDITEIPGADYLHDPEGVILETERKLSERYHSSHSKMLVNGSTVGIISMIMGVVGKGERLLLNRNAHKSVYHAIEIGEIIPSYFTPYVDNSMDIATHFNINEFERFLDVNSDAKACLFTYPTYEGLCYDLKKMIDACHQRKMIVLVDEAHGAHLHLDENWPASALSLGADVVVQSFHKTLPALTQTAGLHINRESHLSSKQLDKIFWHLKVLQTSSPSYLLMASIDAMLSLLDEEGEYLTCALNSMLEDFKMQMQTISFIKCHQFKCMDPTKVVITAISPSGQRVSGMWLSEHLRNIYGIQVEYATENLCLLMASISNMKEDWTKLVSALKSIDRLIADHGAKLIESLKEHSNDSRPWLVPEVVYAPYETVSLERELVALDESVGRISAESVIPYPPGIPLIIPGERITEAIVEQIMKNVVLCLGDVSKGINVIIECV